MAKDWSPEKGKWNQRILCLPTSQEQMWKIRFLGQVSVQLGVTWSEILPNLNLTHGHNCPDYCLVPLWTMKFQKVQWKLFIISLIFCLSAAICSLAEWWLVSDEQSSHVNRETMTWQETKVFSEYTENLTSCETTQFWRFEHLAKSADHLIWVPGQFWS